MLNTYLWVDSVFNNAILFSEFIWFRTATSLLYFLINRRFSAFLVCSFCILLSNTRNHNIRSLAYDRVSFFLTGTFVASLPPVATLFSSNRLSSIIFIPASHTTLINFIPFSKFMYSGCLHHSRTTINNFIQMVVSFIQISSL